MTSRSIESIDLKMLQLKNERSQLLAKQCDEERKLNTRQAIIIGKWLMVRKPELVTAIANVLERKQDRAAFNLPPKAEKVPQISGSTHVDILLPLDDRPAPPSTGVQNSE
ncbi:MULTISPECIES: hypothetical protein [unclassified Acidovorax]|uniref:hypothetical protein n=1 Tax=unclassified Acidovorax TaxID=2684926 RepID=UPI001C4783AB|nr:MULTISPECIES: hypothetical protein [unclassified Acidovorax]MBV7427231.1 hypothetical protein [Acidovorax sp. sif0732]MBV7448355.1 hypothetical protein [Acidovorax sp. sif0715]